MADRNIEILTPATNFDLITLSEAKLMTGMSVTDTSDDAQMQLFIDISSAVVAAYCNNRTFAKERVREEWRELSSFLRIFPSHWPIKVADLESVESPSGTVLDPSTYVLEEYSGKISCYNGFTEPVVVTYTGGYDLPSGAPEALKSAVAMLIWQEKLRATTGAVAGIRMLSHKDSRVMFHDPTKIYTAAMGAAKTPVETTLMKLLSHFTRFEV
jgi:hypothetical protein